MKEYIQAIIDKIGTFDKEPPIEIVPYEESGWPEIFEELEEANKRHRDNMIDLINTINPFF